MNSINWPASSVWVFIAQLGEHCSANAEATGSNPVEAPKNAFSGYFRNCLNCDSLRWSHTHSIYFFNIIPSILRQISTNLAWGIPVSEPRFSFNQYLKMSRNGYSATPLYGHPLNTDTQILRTVSFVPTKSSYIFSKINLLNTDTAVRIRTTDTSLCPE